MYLQAVMQVQAKDYKAADATLDKINAYIGRIPRGYFLQAIVKEQLGQTAQAEEAIRRYIARAPNDLAAYKLLARLQFAKRRPDLAADTLAKVVQSGHADAGAYDLLGRAYAATGRGDDSVKAFQKAESSGAQRRWTADAPGERAHGSGRGRCGDGRSGAHAATGADRAAGW